MDEGLWRQKPRASWKAIPITSRTLVPSSTTSIPTTFAVPDVGFRIVQRIMSRVVLPDPFGPRITIISPSLTVKFKPRRASVFPYLFERSSVSTANKLGKRLFSEMGDKNVEPRRKISRVGPSSRNQKNDINKRRNDRGMKFGVCVPNYGESSSTEALRNVALEAEQAGCDSLWTTDHILMARNSGTPYETIFESITTLSYLAAITSHAKLGISSLITAMRNPVVVAKQLATIDNLSGGRLMLATSAGWNEKEFAHLGSNFHNRGKRLDASIRLIRALWRGETSFKSRILGIEFNDAVFEPRPIQKHLSMWIGGTGQAAMRRAATLGDAWHPNVQSLDQFTKLVADFREISPETRTKEICVRIVINPKSEQSEYKSAQGERRMMLSGNQAQNKQTLSSLEQLGVSYIVAVPSPDGKASVPNQVDAIKTLSKLLS